jgi:hypothetical protein
MAESVLVRCRRWCSALCACRESAGSTCSSECNRHDVGAGLEAPGRRFQLVTSETHLATIDRVAEVLGLNLVKERDLDKVDDLREQRGPGNRLGKACDLEVIDRPVLGMAWPVALEVPQELRRAEKGCCLS